MFHFSDTQRVFGYMPDYDNLLLKIEAVASVKNLLVSVKNLLVAVISGYILANDFTVF